jgi:hypothetical protein
MDRILAADKVRIIPTPAGAAGTKYTRDQVRLILSQVPTHDNAKLLARALGRTTEAIRLIQNLAYSGKWLKETLSNPGCQDPEAENIHKLVGEVKKELGIAIGHMPK